MLVAQAVSYTMQICCAPWVFFLSGNSFHGLPSVAYNSLNIPQISFEVEFGFIGSGEFKCITCFSLPVEEWLVDSFTTKKGHLCHLRDSKRLLCHQSLKHTPHRMLMRPLALGKHFLEWQIWAKYMLLDCQVK